MTVRAKYLFVLTLLLLLPVAAIEAQGAVRMVGIPFEPTGNTSVQAYIQALYRLAIGVAALLAVVKLILAGAKYILSDVITQKEDAKQDIRSAIIGLLIVLSAALILSTINPNLLNLRALDSLDGVSAVLYQDTTPRDRVRANNQPFISGENFVAESRECNGPNEQFYVVFNEATGLSEPDCRSVGSDTNNVAVGSVTFDQDRVYTDSERDTLIAQIEAEFTEGNRVITPIVGVTNDSPKITEIQNNISQCEINGFRAYRLNSQIAPNITDVDIICVR